LGGNPYHSGLMEAPLLGTGRGQSSVDTALQMPEAAAQLVARCMLTWQCSQPCRQGGGGQICEILAFPPKRRWDDKCRSSVFAGFTEGGVATKGASPAVAEEGSAVVLCMICLKQHSCLNAQRCPGLWGPCLCAPSLWPPGSSGPVTEEERCGGHSSTRDLACLVCSLSGVSVCGACSGCDVRVVIHSIAMIRALNARGLA